MIALTRARGRHRVLVRRSPFNRVVLGLALGPWIVGLALWLVLR